MTRTLIIYCLCVLGIGTASYAGFMFYVEKSIPKTRGEKTMRLQSGREIDTSCPNMSNCWADQACITGCPPTLLDVLRRTAELEHELEMLPHTDPDILEVCPDIYCRHEQRKKKWELQKDLMGRPIMTANEVRLMKKNHGNA